VGEEGEQQKDPPFPDQDPEIRHGSHGALDSHGRNHEPTRRPTRIKQRANENPRAAAPIQRNQIKAPSLMADKEKKSRREMEPIASAQRFNQTTSGRRTYY